MSDAVEHAKGLPANPARAAVLRQAQNMVWELRVSLFAQQLGTAHKVSAKRISRLLASAPALSRLWPGLAVCAFGQDCRLGLADQASIQMGWRAG